MEPTVRFELTTHRLQGGSSTTELSWHLEARSFLFLLFWIVVKLCNTRFSSSSCLLFKNTNFTSFINILVECMQFFFGNISSFCKVLHKLLDCHLHSQFEIVISLVKFDWSRVSFFCWFCNWHKDPYGIKCVILRGSDSNRRPSD